MERRIIRTRLFVQLNVLAVLVTIASVLQWHPPLAAATDVDEESDGDSSVADVREDQQEEERGNDEDGEELNDDEQNEGDSDEGTAKQGQYSDRHHQKRKKVFVPVFVPDKEKKKMKIISVDKGFYVQGGTQLFGKFKSLKHCMKACATDSSCFEGDFNPWLHKCYAHTNTTACGKRSSHPQYVHFSKVPCAVTDAPRGKIVIGATMGNGIEVKGVENIQQCIKKCVNAGRGIVASVDYAGQQFALQACFAIDYDFANHKCFVFGSNIVQAAPVIYAVKTGPTSTPIQSYFTVWTQCNVLRTLGSAQGAHPNPSGVHISFCPTATLQGFVAG